MGGCGVYFSYKGREALFFNDNLWGDARVLIGSFEHMLDAKGRVFIPAKWREDLGDALIVTLGLLDESESKCLFGMSLSAWRAFSEKLAALPMTDVGGQAVRRRLYAAASCCELDKQGRILIPANLREQAELSKDATLIGVGDRIEVWNPVTLRRYEETSETLCGDALAHMAQLGI